MNHIVASFGPFLARLCTLGRLFPYAMIPDVRRLPAGEGPQGAACTATLEEETFSQQAADQTSLVRHVVAKLGVKGSEKDYNSIYGIISEKHPWGHTIWQGLYMEIKNGMGHHWKGGPQKAATGSEPWAATSTVHSTSAKGMHYGRTTQNLIMPQSLRSL